MKHFYIAATREQNGKYYSYILSVSESDNIKSKLMDDVKYASIMPTKKKAMEVANFWNECHKKNGKYLYDDDVLRSGKL